MAGQIRMSPEEFKSKATRYGQGANQIEDILSQLQNFAQLLQEINMQLNKTAEAVASHDEELSRNFGLK
ncbi:hypothetical protein [Bacillus pretiosus]|uniref:hypothetical protein n=1 Tax=Bacillus pretiosus TaxID=2983392 RepID=UPI003D64CE0E